MVLWCLIFYFILFIFIFLFFAVIALFLLETLLATYVLLTILPFQFISFLCFTVSDEPPLPQLVEQQVNYGASNGNSLKEDQLPPSADNDHTEGATLKELKKKEIVRLSQSSFNTAISDEALPPMSISRFSHCI